MLEHGSGRNDAILIAVAARDDSPDEAAAMARALAPSAERLREAEEQGAAFARTTAAVWGIALPPLPLPVAIGRAARALGLPAEPVARHYLLGFAGQLVSVAVRLVPLGQTDGQRVLAGLAPLCTRLAGEAATAGLDDLGGAAFLSDVASMRHEAKEVRVFRS